MSGHFGPCVPREEERKPLGKGSVRFAPETVYVPLGPDDLQQREVIEYEVLSDA